MTRAKAKGTPKRTYLNHSEHTHPATKYARDQCRRMYDRTGQPWDGVTPIPPAETLTRGQKAAATRKRREGQRKQAIAVESLLAASEPQAGKELTPEEADQVAGESLRDAKGRFTQATLARWGLLIDQMNDSRSYIESNGIELLGATLVTSLGGQKFVAEFDGTEWVVTAE